MESRERTPKQIWGWCHLKKTPQKVFPDEKSWNTEQMPQRAQIQILELEEYRYDLGRLHCVVPNQSTDYVGLTSQVRVQQGNHGPA